MGAPAHAQQHSHGGNWWKHAQRLMNLAWPNVITNFLRVAVPIFSSLFVGHLGPEYLGGAALGNMLANATGFSIGSGMAMALDTLCSQAYGAKKYRLVGLHCQRAMAILTLICIPIIGIWWEAAQIPKLVHIDEQVAEISGFWVRRLIPGLWPMCMVECLRRYLLGQKIVWPLTVAHALVLPLHITNLYILVIYFDLGFSGAAWSNSLTNWMLLITMSSLIIGRSKYRKWRAKRTQRYDSVEMALAPTKHSDDPEDDGTEIDDLDSNSKMLTEGPLKLEVEGENPDDTWPPLSSNIFKGWKGFFRLGAPAAASTFIEASSFEINSALAGVVGKIPLAIHTVLTNTAFLWYMPPAGLASATAALIGNALGANHPSSARRYAMIAFVLAIAWGVLNGMGGMLYRDYLGRLYSNDEVVISGVASMMPVMWIYEIADCFKCVGMGVLRGAGRPAITVRGNLISSLIFGYPVGLVMAFKLGFGLPGLWTGMTVGWAAAGTIYFIIISRTNWQTEADLAAARNNEGVASIIHSAPSTPNIVRSELRVQEKEEKDEEREKEKEDRKDGEQFEAQRPRGEIDDIDGDDDVDGISVSDKLLKT